MLKNFIEAQVKEGLFFDPSSSLETRTDFNVLQFAFRVLEIRGQE